MVKNAQKHSCKILYMHYNTTLPVFSSMLPFFPQDITLYICTEQVPVLKKCFFFLSLSDLQLFCMNSARKSQE